MRLAPPIALTSRCEVLPLIIGVWVIKRVKSRAIAVNREEVEMLKTKTTNKRDMSVLVLAGAGLATLLVTVLLHTSPVAAGALDGTWLRPKTGKQVKSFPCGGGLGLKVVHSGQVIMCGAKPTGGGKYSGDLTSTEDGNVYSGTVTMGGSNLQLSGCVLGGLICKNETWSRVN